MVRYTGNKGHVTVIGLTRNGKSFFTKRELKTYDRGVLYFNTKQESTDLRGFMKIDSSIDCRVLVSGLRKGRKYNYFPKDNSTEDELVAIINLLLKARIPEECPVVLAIDEMHLYERKGTKAMVRLATIGLGRGVRAFYITQRLAFVNNGIMTQCDKTVFFKTKMEGRYYKTYGIDPHKVDVKKLYGFNIYHADGKYTGEFKV